jgi:hypothetical protein
MGFSLMNPAKTRIRMSEGIQSSLNLTGASVETRGRFLSREVKMFSTRSLKLLAWVGLSAVMVVIMGASAASTAATSRSVQVLERQGSSPEDPVLLPAARVRAEIPSNLMQPLVPYDASEFSSDDYARVAGPHTVRDEIPSDFIYPLASDTVQDKTFSASLRAKIPSNFTQPVEPYDPGEVSPAEFTQPVGPHNVRDEIPSEFIYPVTAESKR